VVFPLPRNPARRVTGTCFVASDWEEEEEDDDDEAVFS
jgi:hypothetical protein